MPMPLIRQDPVSDLDDPDEPFQQVDLATLSGDRKTLTLHAFPIPPTR